MAIANTLCACILQDFFITLGADILFDLPNLTTIRLVHEEWCIIPDDYRNSSTRRTGIITPPTSPQRQHQQQCKILDKSELSDYLVTWNRYCRRLRCVQLS